MPGMLALIGGDEFGAQCRPVDEAILAAVARRPARVLILPTANVHGQPEMAIRHGEAYFRSLGAEVNGARILTPADARDMRFDTMLEGADVLYLSGGDPSYLRDTLRDSHVLEVLLRQWRRGAVLAGSSAGAMVLGEWMWLDQPALGIVPGIVVVPHFERQSLEQAERMAAKLPAGMRLLGIDAQNACLITEGTAHAAGHGRIVVCPAGGSPVEYRAGELVAGSW